MEYRPLGATGLTVSALAFGGAPAGLTNYLSAYDPDVPAQADGVVAAVVRALELGITYFDTALGYGDGRSERIFGRARGGGAGRADAAGDKGAGEQARPEDVVASAEASLRNLGVETVDVLQLHGGRWTADEAEPGARRGRPRSTPGAERQGKARAIGFTAETGSPGTYALIRSGAFDVLQIAYSIIYQGRLQPDGRRRPDRRGGGAGDGGGDHALPLQRGLPEADRRRGAGVAAQVTSTPWPWASSSPTRG